MQRRYVAVRGASLAGGGFSELVRRYFGEQAAFGEGSRQREKKRQLCEVSGGVLGRWRYFREEGFAERGVFWSF